MIVFFLPDAATCSPFLRRLGKALDAVSAESTPAPVSPLAGSVGEGDLERVAPFTTMESNEIYVECLKVASASFASWSMAEDGCLVPLSQNIHRLALIFGNEGGFNHHQVIGVLREVAKMILASSRDPFNCPSNDFVTVETNLVAALLPIASKINTARGEAFEREVSLSAIPPVLQDSVKVDIQDGSVCIWHPESESNLLTMALEDIRTTRELDRVCGGLAESPWISKKVLHAFERLVCEAKGWEIYTFDPSMNQERA